MENRVLWSHEKFAEYFKSSPRRAFEYRRDTCGDAIPNEYLTEEEKEAIANGIDINAVSSDEQVVTTPELISPVAVEETVADIIKDDGSNSDLSITDLITTPEVVAQVDEVKPEEVIVEDPVIETTTPETPIISPEETVEEEVEVEYTVQELKAKLDTAGVKYFKGAKAEKIVELCQANNLL